MGFFSFTQEIAIDLGTANTIIICDDKVVVDEPSVVARFAVDVAQAFNKFYNANRINVEEKNVRDARMTMVHLTRKTIKDALLLLGIECPEQM